MNCSVLLTGALATSPSGFLGFPSWLQAPATVRTVGGICCCELPSADGGLQSGVKAHRMSQDQNLSYQKEDGIAFTINLFY